MIQVKKPKQAKIAVVLVKRTAVIFIFGTKNRVSDGFLPNAHCFCPNIEKILDANAKSTLQISVLQNGHRSK